MSFLWYAIVVCFEFKGRALSGKIILMVEVELSKIIIDEKRHDQVIVLKEVDGERFLPIVIGLPEATSIKMKISGFEPPRPLTHDMLKSVIEALGARVRFVVVDKLQFNTFHAKVVLEKQDGEEAWIDARPSDSIALALRVGAPIYVEEEVLNSAEMFDV